MRRVAGTARHALESLLATAVPSRRWFGAKARTVRSAHILDAFPVQPHVRLALVEFQFDDGAPEVYQLPLAFAPPARAAQILAASPGGGWADVRATDGEPIGLLYDALFDPEYCTRLLTLIETSALVPGSAGKLAAWQTEHFPVACDDAVPLTPRLSQAEQSNSSVVFGDRLILKLFRRIEQGQNPDLELTAHLTARQFRNVPALVGAIDDRTTTSQVWTLAALQEFVPNQGDAWQYLLNRLQAFLGNIDAPPASDQQPLDPFVADAQRLGTRTAEMHLALADAANDAAFAPEPLSGHEQRRFAGRTRQLVAETFALLRRQLAGIASEVRPVAQQVFERESAAMSRIAAFESHPVFVDRIRCHGDYHLGQVLVTAGDFMIIDFEGEPARPLLERREKQVALRDVAGMIRSFHYASRAAQPVCARRLPPTPPRSTAGPRSGTWPPATRF